MVLRLSPEEIKGALAAAGFEAKEVDRLSHALIARQDSIRKHFPDIAHHIDGLYHNPTHAGSLSMADAWLEQKATTVKAKLSPDMLAVVDDYKDAWAGEINNILWNNKAPSSKNLASMGLLDSAIEMSGPLTADTTLWRWQSSYSLGLTPDTVQSLAKSVYHYKGYASTSLHPNTSLAGTDVLWRFDAEAGVKGLPTRVLKNAANTEPFPNEFEFIIARGQVVVIDSVEKVASRVHGNMMEHWQINARIVNPDNLSRDAEQLISTVQRSMAEKNLTADKTYGTSADEEIARLVQDLYDARKPPEIPVLKDSVEVKTPAMLAFEKEISDLQASMKGLDLDDVALKELEMADATIKDTDSFVDGLKQAWSCMKGL